MKKVVSIIIAVILIVIPVSAGKRNIVSWLFNNRFYAETMVVTGVSQKGNELELITVRNSNGFKYCFWSDTGDWFRGDCVSCIMDTKGTPVVMDDEIMSAKYSRPDLLTSREITQYCVVTSILPKSETILNLGWR